MDEGGDGTKPPSKSSGLRGRRILEGGGLEVGVRSPRIISELRGGSGTGLRLMFGPSRASELAG
jgi:hypothetical protein